MTTAIITGITGQDGSYLSKLLLSKGYHVVGLTRDLSKKNLKNLDYLSLTNKITLKRANLLNLKEINKIIKLYRPAEIYNLAAQSSVSASFNLAIETMNFNTISVLNLLETIKKTNKNIKFYQSSSSEMYGKVNQLPLTRETPLHPLSPYAVSKAAAHWSVINYRESYNLFAVAGIIFNHESYLRKPNFFIKKVITTALDIKHGKQTELRVGNLDIKRDFGYSPKYVEAIWLMMQTEQPKDYIICSGKSISLREIANYIFDKLEISKHKIIEDKSLFRPTDISDIYGDNSEAKKELNWQYDLNFYQVLDSLMEEELKNYSKSR